MSESAVCTKCTDGPAFDGPHSCKAGEETREWLMRKYPPVDRDAVLREGFERGAQWAILDHSYRTNGFTVVGDKGPLRDAERDAAIADILRDLFVPKP